MMRIDHLVRLSGAIALTTACSAGFAQADEPPLTVMRAQMYLSTVLPGMEYKPASLQNAVLAAAKAAGGTVELDGGHPTIHSVGVLAPCISTFTFLYPEGMMYRHTTGGVTNEVPILSALPHLRGLQGDRKGSNWNEVVSVVRENNLVDIRYSSTGYSSKINARNHATAARIVEAIEFLRVQCKGASGSGW